MRSDGKRVKAVNPMYEIVPYIMPRRYDAQNFVNVQVDEDSVRNYLKMKRSQGIRMDHMTVLIAAYLRTCAQYPILNRFVIGKKIYQRNTFSVCFVMLKKGPDGKPADTILKVYLEPEDDIFTVNKKLQDAIQLNSKAKYNNSMDKFIHFLLSLPFLPSLVIGAARLMDWYGILPRKIIDLSPFHTSLFVTNLASINTNYIYHHLYDFGTTSIFIAMGKIVPDYRNNRDDRRVMPLGIVMDERIASGHDFSRMMVKIKRYLKDPTLLETPYRPNAGETDETSGAGEAESPKEVASID